MSTKRRPRPGQLGLGSPEMQALKKKAIERRTLGEQEATDELRAQLAPIMASLDYPTARLLGRALYGFAPEEFKSPDGGARVASKLYDPKHGYISERHRVNVARFFAILTDKPDLYETYLGIGSTPQPRGKEFEIVDDPSKIKGLDPILDGLKAVHAQTTAKVEKLQRELSESQAELRKVEQIMRAAGMIEPKPRSENGTGPTAKLGAEKMAQVIEAVKAWAGTTLPDVPGSFTHRDIREVLGGEISEASLYAGLAELRREGVIRAVGKADPADGRGQGQTAFVLEAAEE